MDSAYQSWDAVMVGANKLARRYAESEHGVIERPTSTLEWWYADSEAELRQMIGDGIERANHNGSVIVHHTETFDRFTRPNGAPVYHGWMLYRN
jgi:hypothetical protein